MTALEQIRPETPDRGNRRYDPLIDRAHVFTADRKQLALALAREGHNNKVIAGACKISHRTFEFALECGRKEIVQAEEDPEYALGPTGQFVLQLEHARAMHRRGLVNSFRDAFAKEPRIAMAYLELLGRMEPGELGRRQVVKVEQDRTIKVVFEEKTGEAWQRGAMAQREGDTAQRAIEAAKGAPGSTERNEIIDTTIRETEPEDDNVF